MLVVKHYVSRNFNVIQADINLHKFQPIEISGSSSFWCLTKKKILFFCCKVKVTHSDATNRSLEQVKHSSGLCQNLVALSPNKYCLFCMVCPALFIWPMECPRFGSLRVLLKIQVNRLSSGQCNLLTKCDSCSQLYIYKSKR